MLRDHEYQLIEYLLAYVTDHKKASLEKVVNQRTRHLTVVLENIYLSQNANAVIRTCEGMGLQDVHTIEDTGKYELNVKVVRGAHKWINIFRHAQKGHHNTKACINQLRSNGYTILAFDPDTNGMPLDDVDISKKCALFFGNEMRGLSATARSLADYNVHIPMFGFTESYNISASVAITLSILMQKLRRADIDFKLSPEEKEEVRLNWLRKIVKRSEILEREFMRTIQ